MLPHLPNEPASKLSDTELLAAVCNNRQDAVVYMFYSKFLPIFQYHIFKLFPYKVDVKELVNEFFLYLYEDGWRRLKTFSSQKSSLATWMSVVSFRFFQKYKFTKIASRGVVTPTENWEDYVGEWVQSNDAGMMMDIKTAIEAIKNDRDMEIARLIFINDEKFEVIADRFGLTTDYVYTVKNRLVKQLKETLRCYRR